MYHPDKVAQKILAHELKTKTSLQRYPVDQVRYYVKHFEDLTIFDAKTEKATGFKRNLFPDEIAFIENERVMCRCDFRYHAERYELIEDVITGLRRLIVFNKAQLVALQIISEMEIAGVPIMLLFLKARQLGVSTLFQLIIKHRMLFIPATKAIVASGDEDKTRSLLEKMIEKSTKLLPWWLIRPDVEFFRSGDEFMTVASLDNVLLAQHGRQELGIARGNTANTWHFTELLEWLNPVDVIEAGFEKAVHPSKRTFGVEETTASPRDSWLHRRWEEKEKDYPVRASMTRPVFLPWFVGDDIYPTKGFLDGIPIPESWEPTEHVKAHVESCEEYVRVSPVLSKVYPPNWKMPREQQWWYEHNYNKASTDPRKLAVFLAECPASSKEAFQSRHKSIVPIQLIQSLATKIKLPLRQPLHVSGPDIPNVTHPVVGDKYIGDINYAHRHLSRKWSFHENQTFSSFNDPFDPHGYLWIWEDPRPHFKYIVSVDCGHGVGEDRTVIQVIRIGTPDLPAEQVAEYASDLASAFDVVGLVFALAVYYTTQTYNNETLWAMVCPEDAADGLSIIREMMKYGWTHFYTRQKPERKKGGFNDGNILGWHTDSLTRPTLITWLLKFIKEGRIKINSPWTIDELRSFVVVRRTSVSGAVTLKIQHERSAHDDRLFALGIGIVAGHSIEITDDATSTQWEAVATESSKAIQLPEHGVRKSLDIPEWLRYSNAESESAAVQSTALPDLTIPLL